MARPKSSTSQKILVAISSLEDTISEIKEEVTEVADHVKQLEKNVHALQHTQALANAAERGQHGGKKPE